MLGLIDFTHLLKNIQTEIEKNPPIIAEPVVHSISETPEKAAELNLMKQTTFQKVKNMNVLCNYLEL